MAAVAASVDTKGGRTRRALLDAAIVQFAAAGQRGASIPAIAREVGLTPSAVYAYFPSKQALFDAAMDADAAGLIGEALPDVLSGSFDGDFARVFRRLLRGLKDHPLAYRVLSGAEGSGAERLTVLPSEIRLHAGIATALRRGQRDGTVRADIDPDVVAIGLESVVTALLISILQVGGQSDPVTSEGVIAVLDAAIRAPATPPLLTPARPQRGRRK